MSVAAEDLAEPHTRRPWWLWLVAALVLVLGIGAFRLTDNDGRRRPAALHTSAASPAPTGAPATSTTTGAVGGNDQYLRGLVTQDVQAVLTTAPCPHRCTTRVLRGADLTRAATGFTGLRAVTGSVVERSGSGPYVAGIVGYAANGTLVHLYAERVASKPAGLRVTDTRDAGSRVVVLAVIAHSRRLTATLQGPDAVRAEGAATTWLHRSTLPD